MNYRQLITVLADVFNNSFTTLHYMQRGALSKHVEEFAIIGISVLEEIYSPSDFEKLSSALSMFSALQNIVYKYFACTWLFSKDPFYCPSLLRDNFSGVVLGVGGSS